MNRRAVVGGLATLVATAGREARGAEYPVRPVKIVVGFPPGGASDILARSFGQELSRILGQQFYVENQAGANSLVATRAMIRSDPDGYALMMTHSSVVTNAIFYPGKPYDPVADVTPVATVARSPFVLLAHPSLGATTMPELLALARSKPGQINYGSPGLGSMQHLTTELMKAQAGIDIVQVPYAGGGPALTDLLAGRISLMFFTTVQGLPFVRQGQLVPLAVTSPKRLSELPTVATVGESLPGFESDLWHGLVAPPHMPAALLSRLNEAVAKAARAPAMSGRLADLGAEALISSPAQFSRLMAEETAKWTSFLEGPGAAIRSK